MLFVMCEGVRFVNRQRVVHDAVVSIYSIALLLF